MWPPFCFIGHNREKEKEKKKKSNGRFKHLLFYIKNEHLYGVLASEAFSVPTPSWWVRHEINTPLFLSQLQTRIFFIIILGKPHDKNGQNHPNNKRVPKCCFAFVFPHGFQYCQLQEWENWKWVFQKFRERLEEWKNRGCTGGNFFFHQLWAYFRWRTFSFQPCGSEVPFHPPFFLVESQAGIDFLGLRCSRLWPEIENLLCISVSWHPCVPTVLLGTLGSLHSSGFPYERLFGIVSAQPWTQCGFWDWNPSGAMRGYGAWSCTKEMGNGERCFAGGAGVRMGLSWAWRWVGNEGGVRSWSYI